MSIRAGWHLRLPGRVLPLAGIILLAAGPARGDDDAYVCLGAGTWGSVRVQVVDDGGACAGFDVRNRSGKVVQSFRGLLGSGYVATVPDGTRVVFIHHFPYATVDEDGWVRVEQKDKTPISGVQVFGEGRLLASFDMNDLLARQGMVQKSASHVQWVRSVRLVGRRRERLVLETTSLRRIEIDLVHARILSAGDSLEWKRCPVIASGGITSSSGRWRAVDLVFAKGAGERTVEIKKDRRTPPPGAWYTLCLRPATRGKMAAQLIFEGLRYNTLR